MDIKSLDRVILYSAIPIGITSRLTTIRSMKTEVSLKEKEPTRPYSRPYSFCAVLIRNIFEAWIVEQATHNRHIACS